MPDKPRKLYYVMLRANLDDVPCGIYSTKKAALTRMRDAAANPYDVFARARDWGLQGASCPLFVFVLACTLNGDTFTLAAKRDCVQESSK